MRQYKQDWKTNELVHRQVMETHIKRKLLPTEIVHHINGDKKDNRIENLKIMTAQEHNRLHHQKYPRIKACVICGKEYEPSASKRKTGKVCSKECKIELDKIYAAKRKKPISQFTLDDKFVKTWDSAREVQNELGFCESNINKCLKGNIKTAYGYKWKYSATVNVVEDIARAIGGKT